MSKLNVPVGAYKMNTFAKLTGFSPAVLRAWERRYGILEPVRLDGGHRAYTEDDRLVIERVREMMDEGRSIGEVALVGREKLLDRGSASLVPMPKANSDRLEALKDMVVDGAKTIQSRLIHRALDDAFSVGSPTTVIDRVVVPAAIEIGAMWQRGEMSIAGEHLAISALTFRVQKLFEMADGPENQTAPVVCACVPQEHHELGLLILALNVVKMGLPVSYLGANMPFDSLEQTFSVLKPRALCLSVSLESTLIDIKDELIEFANRTTSRPPIHIGGSGVTKKSSELLAAAGIHVWVHGETSDLLIEKLKSRRAPRQSYA